MSPRRAQSRLENALRWIVYGAFGYAILYVTQVSFSLLLTADSPIEYLLSVPDTILYWLFVFSLVVIALTAVGWLYSRVGLTTSSRLP